MPSLTTGGLRRLWLTVALLMMLTPLGILAAGAAWGEWSPADLADAQARERIASASGGQSLPAAVPAGLARLATFWTAPIPAYAPAFVRSPSFGYLLSAMFGVGAFGVVSLVAGAWVRRRERRGAQPAANEFETDTPANRSSSGTPASTPTNRSSSGTPGLRR